MSPFRQSYKISSYRTNETPDHSCDDDVLEQRGKSKAKQKKKSLPSISTNCSLCGTAPSGHISLAALLRSPSRFNCREPGRHGARASIKSGTHGRTVQKSKDEESLDLSPVSSHKIRKADNFGQACYVVVNSGLLLCFGPHSRAHNWPGRTRQALGSIHPGRPVCREKLSGVK